MKGLQNRTAIVTGGGSGLGRGIVLRLAEAGVRVGIIDVVPEGAQETVRQVEAAGGTAVAVIADVVDYSAVERAVDEISNRLGPVTLLVNNAGWDQAKPFLQTEPAFWQKVVSINLYGPLNLHHIVVPKIIANGGGNVVNIASDAGRVGSSGEAVYSACKAGIIAFGKTLSRELVRQGVVVNAVCPGPSDTPLFASFAADEESGARLRASLERAIPLRRLGTPEDVAGIVAFLLSDEARFIVGQTISVSGGLTMHG